MTHQHRYIPYNDIYEGCMDCPAYRKRGNMRKFTVILADTSMYVPEKYTADDLLEIIEGHMCSPECEGKNIKVIAIQEVKEK